MNLINETSDKRSRFKRSFAPAPSGDEFNNKVTKFEYAQPEPDKKNCTAETDSSISVPYASEPAIEKAPHTDNIEETDSKGTELMAQLFGGNEKEQAPVIQASPSVPGKEKKKEKNSSVKQKGESAHSGNAVWISFTSGEYSDIKKIAEDTGISVSRALQAIIGSYLQEPSKYFSENADLMNAMGIGLLPNFDDLSKLKKAKEKSSMKCIYFPAGFDAKINSCLASLNCGSKMKSKWIRAIVEKYVEIHRPDMARTEKPATPS